MQNVGTAAGSRSNVHCKDNRHSISNGVALGLHIVTRSDIDITRYRSRVSKWHTQNNTLNRYLHLVFERKSNNNIIKYHPANHKIPVYSNKMKKFDMWTLPWQALWQLPLHIITAQAVAVGCVWGSWWQFSTFQCRIASLWIIWYVDIAIWIALISVSKCGISIGIDIEKSVTICSPMWHPTDTQ